MVERLVLQARLNATASDVVLLPAPDETARHFGGTAEPALSAAFHFSGQCLR